MRRGLLPTLLFLLAAGGTLFLGSRILASERTSAERTARERLRARAQEAAGVLVGQASRMIGNLYGGREEPTAVYQDGFLRPEDRRPLERLVPVGNRDPEGTFYLDGGERAEAVDRELDRAAGLYSAASAGDRDMETRLFALFRLAALDRRRGREEEARKAESQFLVIADIRVRVTLEGLVVRARATPPDPSLREDLLRALGTGEDAVVEGILRDAGLFDREAVARRRTELARIDRMGRVVTAIRESRTTATEGAVLEAEQGAPALAAWTRTRGGFHVMEAAVPSLPSGITILRPGEEAEFHRGESPMNPAWMRETLHATDPLKDLRVVAEVPLAEVDAEARRGAWMLAGSLAALLLAGGAAFTLSVRAARRETEAARARADFVTKVGHDLRTPLAVVRMYAETLAAGKVADPAEAREFASVAAREAERLTGMVGHVLDLSRLSEGAGALVRHALDLAALAAEVAAVHRPLLEHAGVAFTMRSAGPLPVLGDSASLRGAVSNLLENAGRHAASGGSVEIETVREGRMAVLRVLDRGPGLPEGMEESVFERFVRGPGAVGPGAGLGLALVREAAEAHGGAATASNREGGGAAFRFALPLAEGEGE